MKAKYDETIEFWTKARNSKENRKNIIINNYVIDMLENGTWVDYGFESEPSFKELRTDVLNDRDFLDSGLYKSYERGNKWKIKS